MCFEKKMENTKLSPFNETFYIDFNTYPSNP